MDYSKIHRISTLLAIVLLIIVTGCSKQEAQEAMAKFTELSNEDRK
jgi:hypothetical protein